MRTVRSGLILAVLAAAPLMAAQSFVDSPQQREESLRWRREARFGMFIYWGLYAIPAGEWQGKPIAGIGEWIMNRARIPVKEYEKLAEQFNPVNFNADEWVRLARDAGQRYIVITSKHHEGFAMFHSRASDYNIVVRTPLKRDPMRELAEACRREGIRLCFYCSQTQDWHHPDGDGNNWDYRGEPAVGDFGLRAATVGAQTRVPRKAAASETEHVSRPHLRAAASSEETLSMTVGCRQTCAKHRPRGATAAPDHRARFRILDAEMC